MTPTEQKRIAELKRITELANECRQQLVTDLAPDLTKRIGAAEPEPSQDCHDMHSARCSIYGGVINMAVCSTAQRSMACHSKYTVDRTSSGRQTAAAVVARVMIVMTAVMPMIH
jgi:hypothetical protein